MSKFFTSPSDLLNWIKTQNHSANEAADKIAAVIGSNDHQQDIAESARRIFAGTHADHASQVIFNILSRYDVTENSVKTASKKVGEIYAANELLKEKLITAEQHGKLVKEAQMIREPGQMDMGMRVCPKLPMSVASRRVSQYTCIHYCNASMVLDDEPTRVYCMETLWRKHVMDKFSRDIKDQTTGKLVGGYINNRFFVFPTAGTPANPDTARDGGNPMELLPGQRTRQPRAHEWSIERRMQEQREKGSTESASKGFARTASSNFVVKQINQNPVPDWDVTDNAGKHIGIVKAFNQQEAEQKAYSQFTHPMRQKVDKVKESFGLNAGLNAGFHTALLKQAESTGFIEISAETKAPSDTEVSAIFSEAIELHNAGVSLEDASVRLANEHNSKVEDIVRIQEFAIRKLSQHQSDVYMVKTAYAASPVASPSALEQSQRDQFEVKDGQTLNVVMNGAGKELGPFTRVEKDDNNPNVFYVHDQLTGNVSPVNLTAQQVQQIQPTEQTVQTQDVADSLGADAFGAQNQAAPTTELASQTQAAPAATGTPAGSDVKVL